MSHIAEELGELGFCFLPYLRSARVVEAAHWFSTQAMLPLASYEIRTPANSV